MQSDVCHLLQLTVQILCNRRLWDQFNPGIFNIFYSAKFYAPKDGYNAPVNINPVNTHPLIQLPVPSHCLFQDPVADQRFLFFVCSFYQDSLFLLFLD